MTRGALYHQFADKAALFRAVAEVVEADVTARLGEYVVASGAGDPAAALHAAVDGWLAACDEPEVRQVLLLDGPVVLGWDGFRDMALRHGLGLTEAHAAGRDRGGQLPAQPTRALAHVLIGALDEAAMYVATAEDRAAARADVAQVLHALLDGRAPRGGLGRWRRGGRLAAGPALAQEALELAREHVARGQLARRRRTPPRPRPARGARRTPGRPGPARPRA